MRSRLLEARADVGGAHDVLAGDVGDRAVVIEVLMGNEDGVDMSHAHVFEPGEFGVRL